MEIGPHTPTEQTTSEYPFSTDQTTFIRGLIEERKALLAGRLDTHKKYGYQIADNVYFLPIKKQMKKIDSELDFLGKVLPTEV
jgi:Tfp pilus assembly protein PilO